MSTSRVRARWVRGALVGVCSAVLTIGAHAAAGGALPHGAALIVSMLPAATIGAILAGATLEGRRGRLVGVIGALTVAQFLGHLSLVVAGGHHGGGLGMTTTMAAGHLAAAVLLGVAITAVEYLYVVCSSVLCWLRLFATAPSRPAAPSPRPVTSDVVAHSVLRSPGLGMRAPPSPAVAAA
ncbi:hypothetical protein [Mycolicibacterium sp. XJ1819]